MKITPILFLWVLSLASVAFAKEKEISDQSLLDIAKKELDSSVVNAPRAPQESFSQNLISTKEALSDKEQDLYARSEWEIGVQSYQPQGTGKVTDTESYSLSELSARPMALTAFRYWAVRNLSQNVPWRAGASLAAGISSNTIKLGTKSGRVYDDVRLSTLLVSMGPDIEFFIWKNFAFGLRLAVGRIFSVQSTPSPYLNQSMENNTWESAASLRYQPSRSFFAKVGYTYRRPLGAQSGLDTQASNFALHIGFGM